MNEKDNYLRTVELSTEQNYNMIDGIPNNISSVLPGPEEKPLHKVKERPDPRRSREREER